ncbi:cytochrome c biogenesis CcdA family protein [Thermohalobacter berrensis]|uniref:Cytochrome c biogenesis protein CcdA n=1 Tax=Thermohalobacter berrensis TaxID=99594 RepID=A0A419T0D4_9FIRM|nr:cytochrome c biogenesis protein CcdA [Thermohalobacter berrensis]RKD30906.1 cytochrome c biogenesis protein CcdA [Thermohalobacter berrensis]
MGDISLIMALVAGFLSFFSPCVFPIVPGYVMYITGSTMEEEVQDRKLLTISRALGFVLGFTIIFMIMGISASFIGKLFIKYQREFTKISGLLIIIFGLNMLGVIKLDFLNKQKKIKLPKVTGWVSSVAIGMAFAAGWTPCVGTVLASILLYAGTTATLSKGAFMLFIYSLGLAIPFILTALIIDRFSKFVTNSEKALKYISKIGGIVIIIMGLLIFTNKINTIAKIFI